MKVKWTAKAERSFKGIIDYLLEARTVEKATNFVDIVQHTIGLITQHPEMSKVSPYGDQSREAFITKHTTMFYRVFADSIEIEYFWGNFDAPEMLSHTNTVRLLGQRQRRVKPHKNTMNETVSKGRCLFCEKTFSKAGINRH